MKLAESPELIVALEGLMLPPVPEEAAITMKLWADGRTTLVPPPPDPPPPQAVMARRAHIAKKPTVIRIHSLIADSILSEPFLIAQTCTLPYFYFLRCLR